MDELIKIPVFEIEQPIGKFFFGKVDSVDLVNLCSKDLSNISATQYDIFQRNLDPKRLPALKKYMEYSRASFPNGIVLTANLPFIYENGYISIPRRRDAFFIIDGQHRVEALKYYHGNKKFEVCVVIFDTKDKDLRAELFTVINSEQKKVNPSVKINLKGNDSVDTPEKIVRRIAIALNDNFESPFYGRIRFTDEAYGRNDNRISLAAFAKPIISAIYNQDNSFSIKDDLIRNYNDRNSIQDKYYSTKCLWKYYVAGKDKVIYLILLNYFTAFKDLFKKDWVSSDSLLMKTTGYNAMFMLLVDLLNKGNKDFSYESIYKLIQPLKVLEGHFVFEEWGVGLAASSRLYKRFTELLNYSAIGDKSFEDYSEE